MLLCPSNLGFQAKRDAIQSVWSWSGQPFYDESRWMKPEVLAGIGSGGVSYQINRWRELVFFTNVLTAFKALDKPEADRIIGDPWILADWLQSIPEAESRQLRHMVLYLLFPDTFERIFGGTDRYQIMTRLSTHPKSEINQITQIVIDRELVTKQFAMAQAVKARLVSDEMTTEGLK